MGNFRLHEFNFLPVYTLVAEVKNQSFQNHLIKILQTFNASKIGTSYMLFVYSFPSVVMSYLTQQKSKKKGANHGNIPLNLAPESDEWEEIKCDEAK